MTATLNSTGVLFNDSTQQNTAFLGARTALYTTAGSYTFTIPTGITALKVTVVGGGGSNYRNNADPYGPASTNGNTGGTSSVSSGSQSISTVSATGGSGIGYQGVPGSGAGGDINGLCTPPSSILTNNQLGRLAGFFGSGGNDLAYCGAGGGHAIKFLTGLTSGNTLSVVVGAGGTSTGQYGSGASWGQVSRAGGAGVVMIEW